MNRRTTLGAAVLCAVLPTLPALGQPAPGSPTITRLPAKSVEFVLGAPKDENYYEGKLTMTPGHSGGLASGKLAIYWFLGVSREKDFFRLQRTGGKDTAAPELLEQHVTAVRATFDGDRAGVGEARSSATVFTIPAGSSRLLKVEIDYDLGGKKTFAWTDLDIDLHDERHTFDIVAKSSIAAIRPPTFAFGKGYDPGGLGTFGAKSKIIAATAIDYVSFAKDLNERFSEDPLTRPPSNPALDRRDSLSGQYRLYSRQVVSFRCLRDAGGWRVTEFRWQRAREETDAGTEGLPPEAARLKLVPPAPQWSTAPLQKEEYLRTMGDFEGNVADRIARDVSFQYMVRGRPHPVAAEFLDLTFGSRRHTDPQLGEGQYNNIAHTVVARAYCPSGVGELSVGLTGTLFPTHHVFVNGKLRKTVRQKDFDLLFVPATALAIRGLEMTDYPLKPAVPD